MIKNTTKKISTKNQSKTKPSLDLKSFSKDADLLFKKYNIETGIIVANILEDGDKYLLSCVNSPSKKEENALLLATQNLFQLVDLTSESFYKVVYILETICLELLKNKTNPDNLEGEHLSKKEKHNMLKIREIKNKLVKEHNYEKACSYREVEKQMLSGKDYNKKLVNELIKNYEK